MTTQTAQSVQYLSNAQLADILNEIDGKQAMFASIVYLADARVLRKDRETKDKTPVNRAFWLTEKTVNLNVNYEAAVNRQLGREDKEQTFQKEERPWGVQVNDGENGSLVAYNGNYYIQAIPQKSRVLGLLDENGENVEYLKDWNIFPAKSKNKKQGTDKPIEVRAFRLDRIQKIKINGVDYIPLNV